MTSNRMKSFFIRNSTKIFSLLRSVFFLGIVMTGIFLLPHFSYAATLLYSQTDASVLNTQDIGASGIGYLYNYGTQNTVSSTYYITNGNPTDWYIYGKFVGVSSCPSGVGPEQFWNGGNSGFPTVDCSVPFDGNYHWYHFTVSPSYDLYTTLFGNGGGYDETMIRNQSGGDFVIAGNGTQYTMQAYDGTATPPCVSNCGPAISFFNPTNGTTTQDFPQWWFGISNVTSSDLYTLKVTYALGQIPYTDSANLYGSYLGSPTTLNKSISLAQYGTSSVWSAFASLYDQTENNTLVATSSEIIFTITTVTSTPGSYTPPATTTLSTTGFLVATSTCSGYLDVTCEVGNAWANIINWLFNIDPNAINAVSGFNMATTPPFNTITDIENTIASVGTSDSTIATTTITFNIGDGNKSVPILSQSMAQEFMGSTFINLIREILYALLLMTAIYGFYLEIRKIFVKPHQN